jgi:hypothetical protein
MTRPHEHPKEWRRGELLNLKRFTDGSFTAQSLYDEAKVPQTIRFTNRDDAQAFVSWWYASKVDG